MPVLSPHLPPLDANGVPMPSTAARGLRIEVDWGRDGRFFDRWSVRGATRAEVWVSCSPRSARFPPSGWIAWLHERGAEGPLRCHLPGCRPSTCGGCDGRLVRDGKAPRALPPLPGNPMPNIDIRGRDARILRAAHDVARNYTLVRAETPGGLRVEVRGGTAPYVVNLAADWSEAPRCTCPDGVARGYCKHVIAVLLAEPAYACQLLELFL